MAYPEPFTDEWYADNQPEFVGDRQERPKTCEICGSDWDVQSHGAMMLCDECRGKEYADEDPDVIRQTMEATPESQCAFYEWWLKSCAFVSKAEILKSAFERRYNKKTQESIIAEYVMQSPEDIAHFVEGH